jgi:hypothetical protein
MLFPFNPSDNLTDGRSTGAEEPDRIAMTPSGRTIAVVVGKKRLSCSIYLASPA